MAGTARPRPAGECTTKMRNLTEDLRLRANRRQFLLFASAAGALAALGPAPSVSSAPAAGSNRASLGAGPAFPATALLDNFNRGTGPITPLGPNWAGNIGGAYGIGYYRIASNAAQVVGTGFMYWKAAIFGANQEAYYTFTKVVPTAHQNLLLKRQGPATGDSSAGQSFIDVKYEAEASRITINTFAPYPQYWVIQAIASNVTMVAGDQFGARAYSDGTVEAYRNGTLLLSVNVTTGPNPWSMIYAAGGGQLGVWFNAMAGNFTPPGDARFDDYGGGSLP